MPICALPLRRRALFYPSYNVANLIKKLFLPWVRAATEELGNLREEIFRIVETLMYHAFDYL